MNILNREELLKSGDIKAKEIALEILLEALKSSDPYVAVKKSLTRRNKKIIVHGRIFELQGKLYVLGFGKASCSMAKAIEEILGDLIVEGLVITKYGYRLPLKKIKVIEAGHPIPDENSLRGAQQALDMVSKIGPKDVLIVLISGGGSSLFVMPEDGISLQDKIKVNNLLLKSGARIHEINIVRKHLSKVKGGKLAKKVKGTLIALILSDVVGDKLDIIASGPTVKDPSTFYDAYKILTRYDLWDKIPESVRDHILLGIKGLREETLKEDLPNVYNFIIGGVSLACESAAKKARELGLEPYILTTTLEGEAKDTGLVLGSIIEEIYHHDRPFKKPCVIICGGETTVTIRGEAGKGGPNQEVALSITRKIKGLRNTAFLSIDTDGTDGPTDAAGGLVDSYTYDELMKKNIDVEEYLSKHDAYNALRNVNALVFTGPTNTNVNSIMIGVILGNTTIH